MDITWYGVLGWIFPFKERDHGQRREAAPRAAWQDQSHSFGLLQPHSNLHSDFRRCLVFLSSFQALEIITIHPFHTFCKEPREERLCCHNWHIKAQPTWHENILKDESAGHVGCVCHGTFAKWLLMDMTASWPCWKKPQSVASLQVMVWVKPVCCYRKFGILFLEYVVLVAYFL